MSFFEAIILGIIQGITEFFPVSSSAHLKLVKIFFHIEDPSVLFDLICHMGTLFALILYFRAQIKEVLFSKQKCLEYCIALIPLVVIYIAFKPYLSKFSDIRYLGYFFLLTSFLLFLAQKTPKNPPAKTYKDLLCIGSMQALALIPGISRSGSTISAARLRGWNMQEAVSFSFLLAIPTILGGFVLETSRANISFASLFTLSYLIAFVCSFIGGLIALRFFFKMIKKGKILIFGWYCLILGIIVIWYYG